MFRKTIKEYDFPTTIVRERSLKLWIGEEADYDKVIARYRSEGLGEDTTKDMKIVPINFNREHKAMLGHCKMILEDDRERIAINPDKFEKIITALRTAVDNDGTLETMEKVDHYEYYYDLHTIIHSFKTENILCNDYYNMLLLDNLPNDRRCKKDKEYISGL